MIIGRREWCFADRNKRFADEWGQIYQTVRYKINHSSIDSEGILVKEKELTDVLQRLRHGFTALQVRSTDGQLKQIKHREVPDMYSKV